MAKPVASLATRETFDATRLTRIAMRVAMNVSRETFVATCMAIVAIRMATVATRLTLDGHRRGDRR